VGAEYLLQDLIEMESHRSGKANLLSFVIVVFSDIFLNEIFKSLSDKSSYLFIINMFNDNFSERCQVTVGMGFLINMVQDLVHA